MTIKASLYDTDYYAWSLEQAALLRAGAVQQIDLENIAEEIESMGKSEKKELASRLRVLMLHLLKWQFQPGGRGASWETTIKGQRLDIEEHLNDNPSLRPTLEEGIASAYRRTLIDAVGETRLPARIFPPACPYSVAQMMDDGFWPD